MGWPAPDDPIKILGVCQTQCHLSVGQADVGTGLRGLISASDALCWSYGGKKLLAVVRSKRLYERS